MKKNLLILIFFAAVLVPSGFAGTSPWTWTDLSNEPAAVMLLGIGLVGLGTVVRKKDYN